MRFWDASALVPLLVEEPSSRVVRQVLRSDPKMTVWAPSRVEAASALYRQHRDGALAAPDVQRGLVRLEGFARRWSELAELSPAIDEAIRILGAHPLRASDALQLGAALLAFERRSRGRGFVTLDDRLAQAAAVEGFDVIVPR